LHPHPESTRLACAHIGVHSKRNSPINKQRTTSWGSISRSELNWLMGVSWGNSAKKREAHGKGRDAN
jgi:hypothetical protein